MPDCDEYERLLSARLDGELSPEEIDRLGAHLAVCPRCRALEKDLTGMERLWRELPPVPAPPELGRRIRKAVAEDNVIPIVPAKYRRCARHWRRWAASAAVLAVILLGAGGLGLLSSGGAPEHTSSQAASVQTASGPEGALSGEIAAPATASAAPSSETRMAEVDGKAPEAPPSLPESDTGTGAVSAVRPKAFSAPGPAEVRDRPTDDSAAPSEPASAAPEAQNSPPSDSARAETFENPAPDGAPAAETGNPSLALVQALPPQAEALALCARQLFPDGETDPAAFSVEGEDTLTLLLPDGSRAVLTCGEADGTGRYPVTSQAGDASTLYWVNLDDGTVTLEAP